MTTDSPLVGRRILLVEDEMMVVMLVEDMLEDVRCSLAAASTVAKALALVASERFDAAILDVNLDGHESYPVADALAARGTPFVFATGYSDAGLRAGYRHVGVMAKPYRRETLVEALSALVTRPADTG